LGKVTLSVRSSPSFAPSSWSLEAGDELTGAELDRHVRARAAGKGDAVGRLADEIDDDLVALDGRMALGCIGKSLLALGKTLELLVNGALIGGNVRRSSVRPSIAGVGTWGSTSSATLISTSLPAS
jgi:hypothetical protein